MQKERVFTLEEAQKKLEHYCAYQERCHQEVEQKLRQMKMIPTAIDRIIGHLIEHNYPMKAALPKVLPAGNSV